MKTISVTVSILFSWLPLLSFLTPPPNPIIPHPMILGILAYVAITALVTLAFLQAAKSEEGEE